MAPPQHSREVLVSDLNRVTVKRWIQQFAAERPPKALVLIGPSGCGMSTLATLCCKELCRDVVRVDGSGYAGRKALKDLLTSVLQSPIRRAVVIEDPEGMVTDGGLAEVVAFVRRKTRIPVLVVCNKHRQPKIATLLQAAEVVPFRYQSRAALVQHFGDFPKACQGDLRQIELSRTAFQASERDFHSDIGETLATVMLGEKVEQAHLFASDGQALVNLMHEHYCDVARDAQSMARVAADLSCAASLSAGGAEEAGFLTGSVTPGLELRKAPTRKRKDTVWSKESYVRSRMRGLARVRHGFSVAGTELDEDSGPVVRQRLLMLAQENRWEDLAAWAPDLNTDDLMGLLRLGFKPQESLLGRIRRSLKKLDEG